MRVYDDSDASVTGFDFCVHYLDLISCEVLGVENEILVAFGVTLLVCPLDVHPEYVYWEAKLSEIPIAFDDHFCGHVSPLAEVESKHMDWSHRYESRHNTKVMLHLFYIVGLRSSRGCEDKELQRTRLGDEADLFAFILVCDAYPGVGRVDPGNSSTVRHIE